MEWGSSVLFKSASVLLLLLTGLLPAGEAADAVNLARAKGATAIGSGSNGPFVISKINDGRTDTLGMWSTDGKAGAFGGVKLGDEPVAFNTIRFSLFNGRAAFTGWRLEGTNDCFIDTDPDPGASPGTATVYDPEPIVSEMDGVFVNSKSKENSVVTITFKPVKYRYVYLVFPNATKPPIGVPEFEVFNQPASATPKATLTAQAGVVLDPASNTITVKEPVPVVELLAMLTKPAGVTVAAYDNAGHRLNDADLLKNGSTLMAKHQTGGEDTPYLTEYTFHSIVDASAPPPEPKVPKPPRAAPPPKPPVTISSAPDAPKDVVNLILGRKITGSVRPDEGATFAKAGSGNWFLTQQIPQWISIDFGGATEFNYFSIASAQVVHFRLQTSDNGTDWSDLVEVDRVRPPYRWNGYFEKVKAAQLRLVVLKPSWDVHVYRLLVANLAQVPVDPNGKSVEALKAPASGALPELPKLPGTP
jgi:hypothetical protein